MSGQLVVDIRVKRDERGEWVAQTVGQDPVLAAVADTPKRALKQLGKMLDEDQVFDV